MYADESTRRAGTRISELVGYEVTISASPMLPNRSRSDGYGQVLSPGMKTNDAIRAASMARIQP